MPLSKSDIAALSKGYAPVISEYTKRELAPLAERLAALEQRIDAVEGQGLKFCGVHQRGADYRRGHAVVSNGSLWIATGDTTATPGKGPDWHLAAKAGRDAR